MSSDNPSPSGDGTGGGGDAAGVPPAGGGGADDEHGAEEDTIGLDGPAPPGGALPASASAAVSSISSHSAVMIEVGRNSGPASVVSGLTEGTAPAGDVVVAKQARALETVREGRAAAGVGPGSGGPSEDGVVEKQARALETVSGDRPPPATTEQKTVIGAVHVPGIGSSPAADATAEGPTVNEALGGPTDVESHTPEERHVTEAYAVDDEGPPPPGPSVLDLPSATVVKTIAGVERTRFYQLLACAAVSLAAALGLAIPLVSSRGGGARAEAGTTCGPLCGEGVVVTDPGRLVLGRTCLSYALSSVEPDSFKSEEAAPGSAETAPGFDDAAPTTCGMYAVAAYGCCPDPAVEDVLSNFPSAGGSARTGARCRIPSLS